MTALSISYTIPDNFILRFIRDQVMSRSYATEADVINDAMKTFIYNREVEEIKIAEREIAEGKGLVGNLDDLVRLVD